MPEELPKIEAMEVEKEIALNNLEWEHVLSGLDYALEAAKDNARYEEAEELEGLMKKIKKLL